MRWKKLTNPDIDLSTGAFKATKIKIMFKWNLYLFWVIILVYFTDS